VPGHRDVAVVEIPAHHDQLRREHDLVSAADLGSPLKDGCEQVAFDADRDLEPTGVQLSPSVKAAKVASGGVGRSNEALGKVLERISALL
jgi:hypothetical protein